MCGRGGCPCLLAWLSPLLNSPLLFLGVLFPCLVTLPSDLSRFLLLAMCAQCCPLSWDTRTWTVQQRKDSFVPIIMCYQAFPSSSLALFSKMLPWETPLPASPTACPHAPVLTVTPGQICHITTGQMTQVTFVCCIFCLVYVIGEAHKCQWHLSHRAMQASQ